jgi:serine/threonine-protein kinase
VIGRPVAIKRLRAERATPTTRERFVREARIAREVQHPHLVQIHEVGGAGAEIWLVLELLRGGSLRQRLGGGPIEVEEAVEIAKDVLRGLQALHGAGLVHRDIKPENLLFDTRGLVKVCDFGIACRFESDETRLTATDGLVGTVAYMAPEQALERDVDPRADLYAVGVVLFEMLSAKLPFGGRSDVGQLAGRFEGRSPDLREPSRTRSRRRSW